MLKVLPPLFGGAWKFSRREAVFAYTGTPGLQYKMKLTKASSIVAAVTTRSGSARRTAADVGGGGDCDLRGGDALRAAAAAGAGGGTYAGCSIVIECFSRGKGAWQRAPEEVTVVLKDARPLSLGADESRRSEHARISPSKLESSLSGRFSKGQK